MLFEARLRPATELPEVLAALLADRGSFDCVVARFAHDNFAQDDRVVFEHFSNFARMRVFFACAAVSLKMTD
jgi:hypothetical protein